MRAIQAGILICLMAITGLLVAIYRQGPRPEPAIEPELAVAAPEPFLPTAEVEPVAEPQAPAEAKPKPRPVLSRPKARPAPPVVPEPSEQPSREIAAAPPVKAPEPEPLPLPPAIEPAHEPEQAAPATLHEETAIVDKPREPRVVTLPAGQSLSVRLDNTLSTSRNRTDDTFFVSLDEPLIVDGLIIADSGARLEGRVVEAVQAGRVKGRARLSCELTRLHTDDGQRVEIRTSTFSVDGESSRNDDLKKVGIGAGAGAILGAIFGGGKGAAIGAASGAGAGAGTAVIARGEPAVLEPETILEFRLAEDVTITEKL